MTTPSQRPSRTAILAIVAVLVLAAAAALMFRGGDDKNAPPKIGVDFALSGGLSFWGDSFLKGLQLAVDENGREHPDSPVALVIEDNKGDAKNAVTAMRKLSDVDKVAVVLSALTPLSKPLRTLAADTKTPLLASIVATLDFGKENDWSFRDYPTPNQMGSTAANYAFSKLNLRKTVALVVNDEYGKDCLKQFSDTFTSLGGSVPGNETVAQADTDMRAQITKLLASNPDSAYLVIRENALGIAVKQFRELGFKGQILGLNAFDSPVVWRVAGDAGDGVVFVSAFFDHLKNEQTKAFDAAFKDKHGAEPNDTNAYGYSVGKYLIPIVVQAKGDRETVRQLLSKMEAESIRGKIRMLPSRDVLTTVAVYKRQGSTNVLMEE
jgi:branched-chain amino acid transport system substrate-binding protein